MIPSAFDKLEDMYTKQLKNIPEEEFSINEGQAHSRLKVKAAFLKAQGDDGVVFEAKPQGLFAKLQFASRSTKADFEILKNAGTLKGYFEACEKDNTVIWNKEKCQKLNGWKDQYNNLVKRVLYRKKEFCPTLWEKFCALFGGAKAKEEIQRKENARTQAIAGLWISTDWTNLYKEPSVVKPEPVAFPAQGKSGSISAAAPSREARPGPAIKPAFAAAAAGSEPAASLDELPPLESGDFVDYYQACLEHKHGNIEALEEASRMIIDKNKELEKVFAKQIKDGKSIHAAVGRVKAQHAALWLRALEKCKGHDLELAVPLLKTIFAQDYKDVGIIDPETKREILAPKALEKAAARLLPKKP